MMECPKHIETKLRGFMEKKMLTYGELLQYLQTLTSEQLNQQVQAVLPTPNDDDVQELMPAIGIDTVANWELEACRSCMDNKYHGEEIVLLLDYNPYAEDGAIAYEWDMTVDSTDEPIYGSEGPTNPNDQRRKV